MARVGPYRRTQIISARARCCSWPPCCLSPRLESRRTSRCCAAGTNWPNLSPPRVLFLFTASTSRRPSSRCTALRFHWAVDEIDPKGNRLTRAQGEYAFDDRADPGYARLVFEPFTATPDSRLELRIGLDGDANVRLRVPRYPLQSDHQQQAGRRRRAFVDSCSTIEMQAARNGRASASSNKFLPEAPVDRRLCHWLCQCGSSLRPRALAEPVTPHACGFATTTPASATPLPTVR